MITHDMAFGEPAGGTGGRKYSKTQITSELLKQAERIWGEPPTFWLLTRTH